MHVEGLRVRRGGSEAIAGLDFDIPPGRVVGLLGPSGCGKTTLLRAIMGVQLVTAGTVTVLGRPAGAPELRHRIGYAAQTPSVYADLSVAENLRYFAAVLRAPRSDPERVITEVSLADQAHQEVGRLSGGQRTRVSLAIALLGSPELLVLDEPTVGLDPVLRQELWSLFTDLARRGVTLLVSSHVMDEAGRCDLLLLMRQGRLLATDSPDHLRRRTGVDDLEQVFLRLIEREGTGETTTAGMASAQPDCRHDSHENGE
ncbi:ABC transporter ATP-binding protein [Salinactinospora qingdaonensis]|uniref:ABC transporter ATP-binding protein n=1 Tax=Salinactinospora qingdaonensis TaxID=702744 RepID=A0ABP7FZ84_9ACTN